MVQVADDVQAGTQASVAQTDAQSGTPGDQAAPSGDIVVTGSRVIANGNNSPTPVTILDVGRLAQTTPSNIADSLNKLPIFSNSSSQRSNDNAGSNAVGNYLNLRGIGPLRTLILFDGRRVPATSATGLVDTNTIPQLLLERVDVVTGGASAVYGSDAVSGVVNFVVDRKFVGVKTLTQAGISSRGDNGSQRLGIAAGSNLFGGRGHLEASLEYFNSDGIDSKQDRSLGSRVIGVEGLGTAANPFRLYENLRLSTYSSGGVIRSGPLAGQRFVSGGGIVPFVHGTATGTANVEVGGDGEYIRNALVSNLTTYQGFVRYDHDLADDIHLRLQAAGTQAKNNYDATQVTLNGQTLSSANAFLPASLQSAASAGGATSFTIGKRVRDRIYSLFADTTNYHVTAGLSGKFGSKFDWDVAYTRAESRQRVDVPRNVNTARLSAALDAVQSPTGQIVCRVALTNPGLYPGCVPLNILGPGSESDAAWDYVTGRTYFITRNALDDATASISGAPFSTWAGDVRVAITGEFRKSTLRTVTNAEPTARNNCTGLRFNCNANTLLYLTNVVASARGEQEVSEGAAEFDIPLLRDSVIARSLNVNAAARFTHYNTSGNATTWKVGLDWHITDDLRLRATRSRDIRAPNVNDLFASENISPASFSDLHTGLGANVQVANRGNPDLRPEKADTLTAGAVYQPSFLSGLSLAVDYYDIKIADAITQVSGSDSSVQRLCEDSVGTSPVCALIVRPLPFSDRSAANFPTRVLVQSLNVASLKQSGVDAEMNYRSALGGGKISLRGLVSYTIKQDTQQFEGAPVIRWAGVGGYPPTAGGLGLPRWKLTTFFNYVNSGWSIDIQQRWRSSLKFNGNPTLVFDIPKVSAVGYTDINLTRTIPGTAGVDVFIAVENLFDKQSDPFNTSNYAATPGFYYPVAMGDDVVGRYFTVGARARF